MDISKAVSSNMYAVYQYMYAVYQYILNVVYTTLCDKVAFTGYSGFRHDITEILLKKALNIIALSPTLFSKQKFSEGRQFSTVEI